MRLEFTGAEASSDLGGDVLSVFRTSGLFREASTDCVSPDMTVELCLRQEVVHEGWLETSLNTLGLVPAYARYEWNLSAVFRDASGSELCRTEAEEDEHVLVHLLFLPLEPFLSPPPLGGTRAHVAITRSVLRAAQEQSLFVRGGTR